MNSLLLLASIARVGVCHSFLEKVIANGIEYKAWNPNEGSTGVPYPSDTPSWYTTNVGGNPLTPNKFNTDDIVCALNGSPANISAPITAGSTLIVDWGMAGQPFPPTHWGPVIDYIAPCNGPCSKVKKENLKFVKIAQKGWINNSTFPEGYWATSELVDADGVWPIKIPAGLKAGEYVVRNELLALHVAFRAIGQGPYYKDGAESYPQCVSIKVSGSGTKVITGGVGAKNLYRGDEPGLALDIHQSPNHADYVIPGPPLWTGL